MNMYAILRDFKTLVKSMSQRATLFGLVIVIFPALSKVSELIFFVLYMCLYCYF